VLATGYLSAPCAQMCGYRLWWCQSQAETNVRYHQPRTSPPAASVSTCFIRDKPKACGHRRHRRSRSVPSVGRLPVAGRPTDKAVTGRGGGGRKGEG